MKAKYWIPGCAIASLSAIEIGLRLLGFGNPALLQADANAGYIFAPNQLVYRFGNRLEYNQFSQRSEQIDSAKPEGTLRILMIGDSVLNGNNTTDQKETIPELFEARLLGIKKQVEVLNASAGSWGIGNQLGYIRKFGTFESDAVMKANWYSRFATTSKQQRGGGKSPPDAESQTVIGNSRSVSKTR